MAKSRRKAKSANRYARRRSFRTEPDRVLIVTEGSKTEPAYFRMLIAELGLRAARVAIVTDSGSAPISVVREAGKQLREDDDFEQVFCVSDRDHHERYTQALDAVRGIAKSRVSKGKTIQAIPSIPCFEFWYLLHVSDSRKSYAGAPSPCTDLIANLKRHPPFEGYDKRDCKDFFERISVARDEATKRAERFLAHAQDENAPEFHEDPSTRVHLVVKALTRIAMQSNRDLSELPETDRAGSGS